MSESNCFVVGPVGPTRNGVQVKMDRVGVDQQVRPAVHCRTAFVELCRFHKPAVETTFDGAQLFRAYPKQINGTFWVLADPYSGDLEQSIIAVDFSRGLKKVEVRGRELRINTGVRGGTVLAGNRDGAIVHLGDGDECTMFFADGNVRVFRQEGTVLAEVKLDMEEKLALRIKDALLRYADADVLPDAEIRGKRLKGVIYGMLDILNLTYAMGGAGYDARVQLLRTFYGALQPKHLENVVGMIKMILSNTGEDDLVKHLYGATVGGGITNIEDARARAQARVNREQKRANRIAADIAQRNLMKGSSNGGVSKQKGHKGKGRK